MNGRSNCNLAYNIFY